ncbi:carboxypeptidase regulatory-like domain-containing protein [Pilimelia columellifera]|uniref:Alpha-amylase n=1 Tax=Pilimelia columellifera subsp. columellifera TaxID=706583 RepID=A0ABN3NG30_9ACTN
MRRCTSSRLVLVLAAVVLTALGAILPAVAAAASTAGTLVVFVVESAERPMPNARVMVFDDDGVTKLDERSTNDVGGVVFPDLADGRYKIFLRAHGMDMWAPGVEQVGDAATYTVRGGRQTTVTVTALPHAVVSGELVGGDGFPIVVGSLVVEPLGDFGFRMEGRLDGEGKATLRVAPGTYRVGFATGGAVQWAPGRIAADQAAEHELAVGDRIEVREVTLPVGSLRGTVVDAAGEPVPGVAVRLHTGTVPMHEAFTNRRGIYEIERVYPGSYRVSFDASRGMPQWAPGKTRPAEATTVAVAAGAARTLDETLLPTGDITGTLLDAVGAPIQGGIVTVIARPDAGAFDHTVETTDERGQFTVRGISVGEYTLGFATPQGRRQYSRGRLTIDTADPVTVRAGEPTVVEERIVPGRTLELVAVDARSDQPVPNFCASLVGPDVSRIPDDAPGGPPGGCTTSGSLILTDLAPGEYQATVRPRDGHLPVVRAVRVAAERPGKSARAVVRVPRGGRIAVAVTAAETGEPVVGAEVYATPVHATVDRPAPFSTAAAGTATSQALSPGRYQLFVEPRNSALGRQWVGPSGGVGQRGAAAAISVTAGGTVTAPPIVLDRAGVIQGRVTSEATGKPMPAVVTWRAEVGSGVRVDSVNTDAFGRFVAGGFGPYAWPLRFTNGSVARQWSGGVADEAAAATVEVVADDTVGLDAGLVRGVPVHGLVTAHDWAATTVTAVSATTGLPLDTVRADPMSNGYRLRVLPGQWVKLRHTVQTATCRVTAWHERADSFRRAVAVQVGSDGAKVRLVTSRPPGRR